MIHKQVGENKTLVGDKVDKVGKQQTLQTESG